jgi:hypothetical protein
MAIARYVEVQFDDVVVYITAKANAFAYREPVPIA